MRTVELDALSYTDIRFRDTEFFSESWLKRHTFSLYRNTPRPSSAFFLISADLSATFVSQNGESVTVRKGDILYIPEGICYHTRVSGNSTGAVGTYTVNFRLFDDEGEGLLLSNTISVLAHTEDNTPVLRAVSLGRAICEPDGIANEQKRNLLQINAAFYSLLDAIVTAAEEHSDTYYPIRIGAAALQSEWNRNEKIEKYAALCDVSPAYFYRCFRAWSGKSPVEYRNLLRLSNAETMLRYTDMRVSEISELIGFEDPFYFCRLFSRHYGSSPQKYRKAFRQSDN